MMRALCAAIALFALTLAPAGAMEKHKLALQISDNDPDRKSVV